MLRSILELNGFHVTETQIGLLEDYSKHLIEWNKKLNLISRKDEENILTRHIVGSITFLFRYQLTQGCVIADVGTGGGLPGIPIGILLPDVRVVLIDSIQKKIIAVRNIIDQLNVKNISTLVGRAENIANDPKRRHSFDYVTARAVAPISDLIRWCRPLLKESNKENAIPMNTGNNKRHIQRGSIILLKGGDLTREIEEAKVKSHPQRIDVHDLSINGIDPTILSDKKIVIIQP